MFLCGMTGQWYPLPDSKPIQIENSWYRKEKASSKNDIFFSRGKHLQHVFLLNQKITQFSSKEFSQTS